MTEKRPNDIGPPVGATPEPAQLSERRNFYGRVHGKTLRPSQKAYLAEDLAGIRLPDVSRSDNPERRSLDLASLFGDRPLWLEVGFGGGEHLVHMAATYPDIGIIGCEPYVNGIAMFLGKARAAAVSNMRIHPGDVRDLFEVLPAASVAKAFLNYPDPWPKARHHRRRFVTPGYLQALAKVMAKGAEFRIATDIDDYVRQALEEVLPAGFELMSTGTTAWSDWLSTRYEQKALREGRLPHYLTYLRK